MTSNRDDSMALVDETSNLSRGAGSTETGDARGTDVTTSTPVIPTPTTSPTNGVSVVSLRTTTNSRPIVTPISLLDRKSRYSNIQNNFGSDTTTAGNTTEFPYDSLVTSERRALQRSPYLDIKGDFSIFPPYNSLNRASNRYNLDDNPTPIQNISTEGIDGFVNHAASPNRMGFNFIPENSDTNPFPSIRPATALQSRIYFKHTTDREFNAGFTRPALGLDNYYAQAGVDTGEFGIRNDRLNKDTQPYIIRAIGQRWGVGGGDTRILSRLSRNIESIIKIKPDRGLPSGTMVTDRPENVFNDRYEADKNRLSGFIEKGIFGNGDSLFIQKQKDLQRQNPFTGVTSVQYGLSDIDTGNPLIDILGNSTPIGSLAAQNPQVYNPESAYSVPGVGGLMYNRIGTNTTGLFDGSQLDGLVDQAFGIISDISERALELSTPALTGMINKGLGSLGKKIGGIGGGPGSQLRREESGILTNQKKSLADRFNTIKNNEKVIDIGKKVKGANEARKSAGLLFGFEKGAAGKKSLSGLDRAAFQDLNVDKVNLIEYGDDHHAPEGANISYKELDWIPFKFVDARINEPIVFRALLSGISDTFSPEYSSTRYVGRPDSVYTYQGTNRSISFSFDVFPKSDTELPILWTKLNYLAGLTYPHIENQTMIAPFTKLTIGDMYRDTPGYISSLTYTIPDNSTWETVFVKLPKFVKVQVGYVFIGNYLPQAVQKHYDLDRIKKKINNPADAFIEDVANKITNFLGFGEEETKAITDNASVGDN